MANFEPAIDLPRGFNAKNAVSPLYPAHGKNLTDIPATTNICSGGEAEAMASPRSRPRQIPDQNMVECRDAAQGARLLHPLEFWRVLIFCATGVPAEVVLVSGAPGSRT
jgi:hypothetical protein